MKKQSSPPPSGERPPASSNECIHENLQFIDLRLDLRGRLRIEHVCVDCGIGVVKHER